MVEGFLPKPAPWFLAGARREKLGNVGALPVDKQQNFCMLNGYWEIL